MQNWSYPVYEAYSNSMLQDYGQEEYIDMDAMETFLSSLDPEESSDPIFIGYKQREQPVAQTPQIDTYKQNTPRAIFHPTVTSQTTFSNEQRVDERQARKREQDRRRAQARRRKAIETNDQEYAKKRANTQWSELSGPEDLEQ